MASPRAILAATKAVPGTARPTAPPQGSQWGGQFSPLVREEDASSGYASSYGPFLPRSPADFTAGAFGPFSPILPVPVDNPDEDSGRAAPRREQFEVGWNLPTGQPGAEGIKLATFSTLRTIADLYSVARACIQLRKNEVKGIGWDITPTPDAAKAMRGDKASMSDFGERRGKAMRFFHRPDPDYFTWSSWIGDVMEQMLVFDALSIYLQPKRGRGMGKGLLGSDLDSLSLIDGETVRPLYDLNGATPRPPAPAYQQYLYGVPRSDMTTVITGRDIADSGIADSAWKRFRGDQLLYLPVEKRRWTPYGFPPVERALLPIVAGLQKQGYALDFFREGTVPAVYISPGDTSMTPNQIRELQDALNAIAGDPAWHHKIIVLPPGSKTEPQRPAQLADQFDEVVMNWVCMSFDVSPMELGISPKVSTTMSPGAANQMSKMAQGSQERKATKPTLEYLGAICNFILQEVCEQDDMRFVFEGMEEEEDEATKTTTMVAQIGAGLLSIDEGRGELGKQPWGLPETSDPGWASATGFLPLGQMNNQGQPMPGVKQPDAQHPAGAPPTPPGDADADAGDGNDPDDAGDTAASGNRGQSPGHEAAEAAHEAGSGSTPGHTSGSDTSTSSNSTGGSSKDADPDDEDDSASKTVTPTARKAAVAELDALARHLRKGRDIATWEPRHLPGTVLATIAADLSKGFTPDEATDLAALALAAAPELVKVGPHGYIHGWIFVGIPGTGDHVFHPGHGHGQVTESEPAGEHGHAHVSVAFDDGHSASFPVRSQAGPGHFERMTDDELATELASGDGARFHHAVTELDRRDRDAKANRVRNLYSEVPKTEEDQNRVYQGLVNEGENPEDAWSHAYRTDTETMQRQASIAQLRAQGYQGRNFNELARAAFKDDVQRRVLDAESATNGVMLNRDGQKAGIDPWSLFTGPEPRARKYASSELGEWWDQNGRPTAADFQATLLGHAAAAGPRGGDFYA